MQDDILELAYKVSSVTAEKVDQIETITRQTRILALNARIEAMRAGAAGAAFGVVAQEIGEVSSNISSITNDLRKAVEAQISSLGEAGARLVSAFRGTRLMDLSLNAIEIIDRNLYERSCDVRWWATDSAVVAAAENPTPEILAYASQRLATILRSYTVYLDLWVTDRQGRVIATGRPGQYRQAVGMDVSQTQWFKQAMKTQSGEDFVVTDIRREAALDQAAVATYAGAVRRGGATDGEALGVLGIFFDWGPQASAVVKGVGLNPEEKRQCRVMLLDAQHRIIAASDERGMLGEKFQLKTDGQAKGYYNRGSRTIAFALTPGYETYRGLGWYGVIEHNAGKPVTAEAGAATH